MKIDRPENAFYLCLVIIIRRFQPVQETSTGYNTAVNPLHGALYTTAPASTMPNS